MEYNVYLLNLPSFEKWPSQNLKKLSSAMWFGGVHSLPSPHMHAYDSGVASQIIPFCRPPAQWWTYELLWDNHIFPGLFLESQTLKNIWAFQGPLLTPWGQSQSGNEAREKR